MAEPKSDPEPRRSELRRLLDDPVARPRVKRAVVSLLGVGLLSIAVVGALVIWHLVRRGRLIRDRLGPPKGVDLPTQPMPTEPEQDRGRAG